MAYLDRLTNSNKTLLFLENTISNCFHMSWNCMSSLHMLYFACYLSNNQLKVKAHDNKSKQDVGV